MKFQYRVLTSQEALDRHEEAAMTDCDYSGTWGEIKFSEGWALCFLSDDEKKPTYFYAKDEWWRCAASWEYEEVGFTV